MRTVISNKVYVYDASYELWLWAHDNLIVQNPDWVTLKRLGKEETIMRTHVPEKLRLYTEVGTSDLIIPFGVMPAIWPMIQKDPYELKFNNNGQVIDKNMKPTMELYDYQEEAVQKLLSVKSGVLQASAGGGKTQIGIDLARRIGRNCLWICGKSDLLNQTVQRIHLMYPNISVGTITDGEVKMVSDGITVSTVQTLVKVDPELYRDRFDVVIVDECHNCVSAPTKMKMFGKIVGTVKARYKYGLTATPSRSDTLIKSMYAILGVSSDGKFKPTFIIEKEKTNTLTAAHIKYDLQTPFSYSTLDVDGTFLYGELVDYLGQNEERNKTIVDNIVKVSEKHKKQLVLCYRIEQCEIINNMLQERGIKSVLLVGKVTDKKRREILNSIIDWSVIVATISLAKEGLDVPELSCLHWAMVIGDKTATIQSAGRIERVCENKPEPEIYDYVDVNYPYCLGKYKKRVAFLKKR